MKKIIFLIFLAIMAIGADAQTTWNIRIGTGMATGEEAIGPSFNTMIQSNIPFKRGGRWTFSPSFRYVMGFSEGAGHQLFVPLEFGYKVPTKRNNIFFPKFGLATGVCYAYDTEPIIGPALDLDFEIKHFVIGLGLHWSGVSRDAKWYEGASMDVMSFDFTFGYKF